MGLTCVGGGGHQKGRAASYMWEQGSGRGAEVEGLAEMKCGRGFGRGGAEEEAAPLTPEMDEKKKTGEICRWGGGLEKESEESAG